MLKLEKSAEKWPCSAGGGGSSDRSDPLGYGPALRLAYRSALFLLLTIGLGRCTVDLHRWSPGTRSHEARAVCLRQLSLFAIGVRPEPSWCRQK